MKLLTISQKLLLASVFVLLFHTACFAQVQKQRFLLEETTAKAGQTQTFEAAQIDYCAAVVRGGAPSCSVMSGTTFSQGNRYLIFLAFGSFSHYDHGTYTGRGLTPEQATELSGRRGPTIAANMESAIELEQACSYLNTGSDALATVMELHLRPGTADAFLKLLQDVVRPAAHRQKFDSFEVYRTILGGDPDRFFIIRRLQHYAEVDDPDPMQGAVPSQQRARFAAVMAASVESSTIHLLRLRPDLGKESSAR